MSTLSLRQLPDTRSLLAASRLNAVDQGVRALPPGPRAVVRIALAGPVGPVRGVERDQLLGLGDRDDRQLGHPDIRGLDEEIVDLGITERQTADLVHKLA